MREQKAEVWLVNTGYAGGRADKGADRMPLKVTRALIDAIHDGTLAKAEYEVYPGWGLAIPRKVSGVPAELLNPALAWKDKASFVVTSNELIKMFQKNFAEKYAAKASEEMKRSVPQLLSGSKL
jgi:phosphoenolpyruvate carboxykinase (ATP)